MTVKEYLESTYVPGDEYQIRKAIKCVDGYSVSVQGGDMFHYCAPREKCNYYEAVELGYPSVHDELIQEYAEDPDDQTETVFAMVPIAVVETLIEKHGGIR